MRTMERTRHTKYIPNRNFPVLSFFCMSVLSVLSAISCHSILLCAVR